MINLASRDAIALFMTSSNALGNLVQLRSTTEADLDFVLQAEGHPDNAQFVSQWSRSRHLSAIACLNEAHYIIERQLEATPVGFLLIAGLEDPNDALELRRLVIIDKGKGYGRASLRLAVKLAFETYQAHRLWLDVFPDNSRAQHLYASEGFVTEGTMRDVHKTAAGYKSLVVMSMLRREYLQANQNV